MDTGYASTQRNISNAHATPLLESRYSTRMQFKLLINKELQEMESRACRTVYPNRLAPYVADSDSRISAMPCKLLICNDLSVKRNLSDLNTDNQVENKYRQAPIEGSSGSVKVK
jgi:hypothetical protein